MIIPSIKVIKIERLHDQFDIELDLNPALNIIYGKNGKGKTTLLHVLANALEQDFRRFFGLRFSKITIETHQGNRLEIEPVSITDKKAISVKINGNQATLITEENDLSASEGAQISDLIGKKTVYLPAFRAILERFVSNNSGLKAPIDLPSREDYLAITRTEQRHLASLSGEALVCDRRYLWQRQAEATAHKTIQCREWFGSTVPIIRYPSLAEVEERLTNEWRQAQFEVSRSEDEMFSEIFARVFETIITDSTTDSGQDFQSLLTQLSGSITALEFSGQTSEHAFSRIYTAVSQMEAGYHSEEATAKRVLMLYVDLMKKRVDAQKVAFDSLRALENSVNFFLDGKQLKLLQDSKNSYGALSVSIVPNGTQRKYTMNSLSSGERQVVTMLFSASRLAMNRGIFLIDEPELSLHIDWQRCILSELMKQAAGRQIIACTHSPEVGADHGDAVKWFEPEYFYAANVDDPSGNDDFGTLI